MRNACKSGRAASFRRVAERPTLSNGSGTWSVGRRRYGHDMRLITWNLGCSYGQAYKSSQPRTWNQLLAWAPDIALIQETTDPGAWLPEGTFVFTPYSWSLTRGPLIGTAVYSRTANPRPGPELANADLAVGQVTLVEMEIGSTTYLVASVHAETGRLGEDKLGDRDVAGLAASLTTRIYPTDVIRDALTRLTQRRRFIVGGDLNLSIRFDDLYTQGSDFYGNVDWFQRVRAAGWCVGGGDNSSDGLQSRVRNSGCGNVREAPRDRDLQYRVRLAGVLQVLIGHGSSSQDCRNARDRRVSQTPGQCVAAYQSLDQRNLFIGQRAITGCAWPFVSRPPVVVVVRARASASSDGQDDNQSDPSVPHPLRIAEPTSAAPSSRQLRTPVAAVTDR